MPVFAMADTRFNPKRTREEYGWYNLAYLPHFDGEKFSQFVTFRLYDSLPHQVLESWRREKVSDAVIQKRAGAYLDSGFGECWLRDERVAETIAETLKFHAGRRYKLHAWVIMPNHVHVLLTLLDHEHLPEIMHSIKSYSAQRSNKVLGRRGQFWQHEYFDRYIRDHRHFVAVVRYIESNPVKAGLCSSPTDWRYSSAWECQRSIEAEREVLNSGKQGCLPSSR